MGGVPCGTASIFSFAGLFLWEVEAALDGAGMSYAAMYMRVNVQLLWLRFWFEPLLLLLLLLRMPKNDHNPPADLMLSVRVQKSYVE